jgi:hypothetical protein
MTTQITAEYCSVEDVFRFAQTAGALVRRALEVDSVDTTADVLTIGGHGCSKDDPVEFRIQPGGTLAAPLSASTVYYAKPVTDSDDLLQIAATVGGAAINLTTTGAGFDMVPSIRPTIHACIRSACRWIDQRIPEAATPLNPDENGLYPDIVRQMAAVLSCEMALVVLGQMSTQVSECADRMRADAKLMLAGLPLPDPDVLTIQTDLAQGTGGVGVRGCVGGGGSDPFLERSIA